MSWLRNILSRIGRSALTAVLERVAQRAADRATNIDQYRKLLAEGLARAAEEGDLDDTYNTFKAANRRAREYIDKG